VKQESNALQNSIEAMQRQIEQFCRCHRTDLLPAGIKSIRTLYGRAGFRASRPQVVLEQAGGREEACRRMCECGLEHLVRVKRLPDKDAIRQAVGAGELAEDLLAACGLRFVPAGEDFYCVVERSQVQGADRQ
jgi:phage host-nuclease inhibitor protein Gam